MGRHLLTTERTALSERASRRTQRKSLKILRTLAQSAFLIIPFRGLW